MAKGDSKSNPIDATKVEGSTPAAAVTGLNITRNGNTFTANWANKATYSEIRFKYALKLGETWSAFSSVTTGKTATKQSFTVNLAGYSNLFAIKVVVSTDQATETKYNVYKKGKKWYRDTQVTKYTLTSVPAVYELRYPLAPSVSVTGGASSTTYHYKVEGTDATANTVFNNIEYNYAGVANWGDRNPAECTDWGATQTSTNAEGDLTQTNRGASYVTAMIRVRSVGPHGPETNGYRYGQVVYAFPYKAVNVRGSASNQSTGYNCVARWDTKADGTHPVNENKVEWYIGTPADTALNCPASVRWEDGTEYLTKQTSDGAHQTRQFYISDRCTDEECLWIRVWQKNLLTNETAGDAVRITGVNSPQAINPVAPTINDIDYDASTNRLQIELNSATTLPASGMTYTTKVYSGSTCKATFTGLQPAAQTIDLGSGTITVKAQAKFGNFVSEETKRTYEPTLECDNPDRYAPTGVKATPGSTPGTVKVTWSNTMKTIVGATVAVSTSAGDWSDADEFDFSGNINNATIPDLLYGVTYYFKVKTKRQGNDESDYSTGYSSATLSAASVTPAITLREDGSHNIVVGWNWSGWQQAKKIELMWSDNLSAGSANSNIDSTTEEVERGGRGGADSYIISGLERGKRWYVWARFGAEAAWTNRSYGYIDLNVTPVAPQVSGVSRYKQPTDEEGCTSVLVSWADMWADTDTVEISWADSSDAWKASDGPSTLKIDNTTKGQSVDTIISNLEMGKTWYVKVKATYEKWSAESSLRSIDLRTTPETPKLSVSDSEVYMHGHIDLSWNYFSEDLAEQGSATVTVTNSNNVEVAKLTAGSEHSIALYPEQLQLIGDATYTLRVRTTSANGMNSEQSEAVLIKVTNKPVANIMDTSLEEDDPYLYLTALPLEVVVSGAENGGVITVYIERSRAVFLEQPDENTLHGYEGELIAVKKADLDGTVEFGVEDLRMPFEDNSEYRIVAKITNQFGSSDPVTLGFICLFDHQALIPEGELETVQDEYIAKITPIAPDGMESGDVCDIYRLSADKPELIVQNAEWGTTYVDPYPALGPTYGYRLVMRTAEGDYTTADGMLAWLDLDGSYEEEPDVQTGYIAGDQAIIDFDNNRVEIPWNLTVSHGWTKDFTETKYLGGAVQGDWNPAVSRTASIGTVMLAVDDQETINTLRRLAVWTGVCHVRTPDGSSFAADVQVTGEDRSYNEAGKLVNFSLDITRVDAEGFDGMTLAEYEGESE